MICTGREKKVKKKRKIFHENEERKKEKLRDGAQISG